MSESIGFVGLGHMGGAMAESLLKAGYRLRVYNRDPRKAQTLVAEGAQQVMRPSEAVEPGGIVITMVADDAALESVTLGKEGILEHLGPGGIHVSMSTVSPAIARSMTELHAHHGASYVAAPVFGRPEAALSQKLWICCAGASPARERVQPVLQAMGQGVFDFGEEPMTANVVNTAEQVEMPMPFASIVHNRLLAGVAKGRGTLDWTALAQLVDEDAGQK